MNQPDNSSKAKKLLRFLFSVIVLSIGIWLIYSYGPKPSTPLPADIAVDVKETGKVITSTTVQSLNQSSNVAKSLYDILGFSDKLVSKGTDKINPNEYLSKLKQEYENRGYKNIEATLKKTSEKKLKIKDKLSNLTKEVKSDAKLYWLEEVDQLKMISAIGKDANPTNNIVEDKPFFCVTLVKNGTEQTTEWMVYRLESDSNLNDRLKNLDLEKGDFPGQDPVGIPRPPKSQRLLSIVSPSGKRSTITAFYKSSTPIKELGEWYIKEMSTKWEFNPIANDQIQRLFSQAVVFTQAERYCILLILPSNDDQNTVVISSR